MILSIMLLLSSFPNSSVILAHFKAKVGKNSKKLKIVRCNNLTILNNILKVPMYPLGAFSIMTRFFSISLLLPYC